MDSLKKSVSPHKHHPSPDDAIQERCLGTVDIPPLSSWGLVVWEHAQATDQPKKGFQFPDRHTARQCYRAAYYFGRKYGVEVHQKGEWLWLVRETPDVLAPDS